MFFLEIFIVSVFFFVLFIVLYWIISERSRRLIAPYLFRLFNADLVYVYNDKSAVAKDLKLALSEAKFINIITARGNDFQNDVFQPVVKETFCHDRIRILLPNPYLKGRHDWVSHREQELQQFDSAYGPNVLKSQIEVNITSLLCIKGKKLEIRLHQYPIIGRIIITDRYLFFTPMLNSSLIRESKIYKFSSSGSMYNNYARLFEQLWDVSYLVITEGVESEAVR